jgi:hypothetical protein
MVQNFQEKMMAKRSVLAKREYQSCSYEEALQEILRRAAGNFLFSEEENECRIKAAKAKLKIQYEFSVTLGNFLAKHHLSPEEFVTMNDDAELIERVIWLLDPIGKSDDEPLSASGEIDFFYPGSDFSVERGLSHLYIKKIK